MTRRYLFTARPKASVGPDSAEYRSWRRAFAAAVCWPWFERCTDGTPVAPIAEPDPFERLKAFAASGQAGCVKARKRLAVATLRGLAAATGKPLPPGVQ